MQKKIKFCLLLSDVDQKKLEVVAGLNGGLSKAAVIRFLIARAYQNVIGGNDDESFIRDKNTQY